ncbi:MAG: hypothetical protein ACRC0S_03150 [Fusobacteriaceae bacterium]
MKKILKLIRILAPIALITLIFTGCGKSSNEEKTKNNIKNIVFSGTTIEKYFNRKSITLENYMKELLIASKLLHKNKMVSYDPMEGTLFTLEEEEGDFIVVSDTNIEYAIQSLRNVGLKKETSLSKPIIYTLEKIKEEKAVAQEYLFTATSGDDAIHIVVNAKLNGEGEQEFTASERDIRVEENYGDFVEQIEYDILYTLYYINNRL